MNRLSSLACLFALSAGALYAEPFADGDTVVFFGDSITHDGRYHAYLLDYYLTRYPDRRIAFVNSGIAGDDATLCQPRFAEDVTAHNPTVVVQMFGMNDVFSSRYALEQTPEVIEQRMSRFPRFEKDLKTLDELLKTAGSPKLYRLTPTPYEDSATFAGTRKGRTGAANALGKLSGMVRAAAAERGGTLVDLYTLMTDIDRREQAKDPSFAVIGPDRVHPEFAGHLVMAYGLLKAQNADPLVYDIGFGFDRKELEKALKARVSDVVFGEDALSFVLDETCLPMPVDAQAAKALDVVPLVNDFNQQFLTVRRLRKGDWTLSVDGTDVGTWTAETLERGVNLAMNTNMPQYAQAQEVHRLVLARRQLEQRLVQWKAMRWWFRVWKVDPDDWAKVDTFWGLKPRSGFYEDHFPDYRTNWVNHVAFEWEIDTAMEKCRAAAKPGRHRYWLRRVPNTGGTLEVKIAAGERWWGGASGKGTEMPFTAATSNLVMDLARDNYANQTGSLLLSDCGRVIHAESPAVITIHDGTIRFETERGDPVLVTAGATLRDAFRYAAKTWFPATGTMPDEAFFAAPQYCTWIELTYFQNQKDILAYARSMVDNGLPPGVLIIDDTWQADYGDWTFDARRFSDPKAMTDELHKLGFKVVVWMCPWVSMDSPAYRLLTTGVNPGTVVREKHVGGFYMRQDGRTVAPSEWWNGQSALLDFTHPNAGRWFRAQLDRLVHDFGVDGFKFDGGELKYYGGRLKAHDSSVLPAEQARLYGSLALGYPASEYRNAWGLAGQGVNVRLIDKQHSWEAARQLVPQMFAAGLLGYPFVCPDMVGGGSWMCFLKGAAFDPELFIRSAQVHALCGQMQFSASPWRVLDAEGQRIVRETVRLRQRFAPLFVKLARESARTGEPMIRPLEYNWPHGGYAAIHDEFAMGEDLLVAPQVVKGAKTRTVVLPPGRWKGDDGTSYVGPTVITVETPLARLPHFTKTKE